jgi:tRNA1Val (adenine37-N6)-methyltransferase
MTKNTTKKAATRTSVFSCKEFDITQSENIMKVSTDAILLGAWTDIPVSCSHILDIGTGSGILALMLAQRASEAMVTAIEIDQEAYQLAAGNFQKCKWSDRLAAINCSLQDFTYEETFDLIICNPPFFSGGVLSESPQKLVARHTQKLSHQDLLFSVKRLLSVDGLFSVVLPYVEGKRFIELANNFNLYCTHEMNVRGSEHKPIERLLLTFSRTAKDTVTDSIVIEMEQRHKYSPEYIALTQSFYLNM